MSNYMVKYAVDFRHHTLMNKIDFFLFNKGRQELDLISDTNPNYLNCEVLFKVNLTTKLKTELFREIL